MMSEEENESDDKKVTLQEIVADEAKHVKLWSKTGEKMKAFAAGITFVLDIFGASATARSDKPFLSLGGKAFDYGMDSFKEDKDPAFILGQAVGIELSMLTYGIPTIAIGSAELVYNAKRSISPKGSVEEKASGKNRWERKEIYKSFLMEKYDLGYRDAIFGDGKIARKTAKELKNNGYHFEAGCLYARLGDNKRSQKMFRTDFKKPLSSEIYG